MREITLPDWTKALPDHALLNAKDVMAIFGYQGTTNSTNYINLGLLPPTAYRSDKFRAVSKKNLLWRLGDLRAIEKTGWQDSEELCKKNG